MLLEEIKEKLDFNMQLVPMYRANLQALQQDINTSGNNYYLLSNSSELTETLSQVKILKNTYLPRGFRLENNIYITEIELFNRHSIVQQKTKKHNIKDYQDEYIPIDLNSIRPLDYLVHIKHGIARFLGLKQFTINNQTREYLSLEYKNGETLNVPVEQMNLLSQYKGSDSPKLSRIGGKDWEALKTKTRNSVKKVAEGLLELYANRNIKTGYAFEPDSVWQQELEDTFPYQETPDQIKSIQEIKDDLESGKIMDRLLCGDVGFGKTEVMIRIAFKAVMSGKQVVVLAPTTILAQQHYKSFKQRLNNFPVNMSLYTRSSINKKQIQEDIKSGKSELIIGTHALLAKSIEFNNLGLLVIDEEQKFGVNHKEKLKKVKEEISVLGVSATPIPRTLNMALSGIQDMSLIATPPTGRVSIKTQLIKENPDIIRASVLRELERGGQVFYLHNRVETIEQKAVELMNLIPEATFRIAHGQMPSKQVEDTMSSFMNHEFDVLIATSIIENGIDIPNANTMIIERANYFGLSQLYQLRGRVGRTNDPNRPGYAVLLYNSDSSLTDQAKQKLEAITRYSGLGSGYQLALQDMEIRGIGDMLGAHQHGRMISVGFELYCEMLNEEINKLKSQSNNSNNNTINNKKIITLEERVVIELPVEGYIPHSFIESEELRLKEYQRLTNIKSLLQLNSLKDEWLDRFGKLPAEVNNLFAIIETRILAHSLGITGQIKPDSNNFITIEVSITFDGWKLLYSSLDKELSQRLAIRFLEPQSKLMINTSGLKALGILNLLREVLSQLSKIS